MKKKKKNPLFLIILVILFLLSIFFYKGVDRPSDAWVEKPIIYLYPTKETNINVKLNKEDRLIVSYPEYSKEWNVSVKPDGKMIDLKTGNKLYGLYYESKMINNLKVEDDGFVVKKDEIISFLEEKLTILGLNDYEKEEFIIYWLPKLKSYEYCYIRFLNLEEIENNMKVDITPKPDNFIRIIMAFKGLKEPIKVTEQNLDTPRRTGYVAVEWGGSEIK